MEIDLLMHPKLKLILKKIQFVGQLKSKLKCGNLRRYVRLIMTFFNTKVQD